MTTPTYTPAQKTAANLLSRIVQTQAQLLILVNQGNDALANGIPAIGSTAAVAAADIQAALGSELTNAQAKLVAFQVAATA